MGGDVMAHLSVQGEGASIPQKYPCGEETDKSDGENNKQDLEPLHSLLFTSNQNTQSNNNYTRKKHNKNTERNSSKSQLTSNSELLQGQEPSGG